MDARSSLGFIESVWDQSITPQLIEYIRIPNESPAFDPKWREHGHMHRAVALIADWCKSQPIDGLVVEVIEHEGRTPIIWAEVPGQGPRAAETVLLYGHLDKQPEMTGWAEGLGALDARAAGRSPLRARRRRRWLRRVRVAHGRRCAAPARRASTRAWSC